MRRSVSSDMAVLLAMRTAVAQGVLWGIMAIGVYLTYKILEFSDLTVDGSFPLGACVSIVFILKGINPFLSLLLAIIIGAIAGAVTGILNTKLKIPGILSSILTMTALYSVNLRILGKANEQIMNSTENPNVFNLFMDLTGATRDTVTIAVGVVVIVLVIAVLYWFFGTEMGSAIRATGNNEAMAKAQGVNTDLMKIIMLAVSNGIIALSGALVAQNMRLADVGMGSGAIVIGLAAVVIGHVIFTKGNFAVKLMSAVLGSIIYKVVIAVVLQLGLKTDDQKLITAILVAIFLSIPTFTERANAKKSAREVQ